jgi:hypothetical protein
MGLISGLVEIKPPLERQFINNRNGAELQISNSEFSYPFTISPPFG